MYGLVKQNLIKTPMETSQISLTECLNDIASRSRCWTLDTAANLTIGMVTRGRACSTQQDSLVRMKERSDAHRYWIGN